MTSNSAVQTIQDSPAQLSPLGEPPEWFSAWVSASDIKWGVKRDSEHCPIHDAAVRALKQMGVKFARVGVGSGQMDVYMGDYYCDFVTYRHTGADFVEYFDNGEPVQPRQVTFTRVGE